MQEEVLAPQPLLVQLFQLERLHAGLVYLDVPNASKAARADMHVELGALNIFWLVGGEEVEHHPSELFVIDEAEVRIGCQSDHV